MNKKSSKQNGDQPATQHDVALWGGEILRRMDESAEETKTELRGEFRQAIQESEQRIISTLHAYIEQLIVNRDEAHHDELDIVAGKAEAPAQWKSVPRRLKTVEIEVEKIKDKLS